MATTTFTSSHSADNDIMDAIFTKVQLADVKYNDPDYRPASAPMRNSQHHEANSPNNHLPKNGHVEPKSEGNSPRVNTDDYEEESIVGNNVYGSEEPIHNVKETENHAEKEVHSWEKSANNHYELEDTHSATENAHDFIEGNEHEMIEHEQEEMDMPHSDGEYYNRPNDMIHLENGIMDSERSSLSRSSQSSESLSPTLPKKNTEHDRLLQELKHHQIQQQIQLAEQATSDSEPETLDSAAKAEIELEHDDDDKTPQNSEDDEDTYYEESDVDDPDVQPVKSTHYHFDSKEVYNTKIVRNQKDEFQKELSRTVHRISNDYDDEENGVDENSEEMLENEVHQATPRPRPVPLQLNNVRRSDDVDGSTTNGVHSESSPISPPYGHYDLRSPSEKQVEVRTPLHESIGRSYTSFEPDKQELIRKEMGHVAVNSIRHLLDRFQQLSHDVGSNKEDPDLEHDRKHYIESLHHQHILSPSPRGDSLSPHQNKIQFMLPPLSTASNSEGPSPYHEPIVKTPHPVALARKSSQPIANQPHMQVFPESEVVLEEQKPVSELLSKFGAKVKPKIAKPSSPVTQKAVPIYGNVVLRKVPPANTATPTSPVKNFAHSKLGENSGASAVRNGDISKMASEKMSPPPPSYYTFWGKTSDAKSNRLSADKEPPIGSVAAIRKSLNSVPTSPVHPDSPAATSPEPVEAEHYSPRGQYQSPKNVRQFYKVYGRKSPNGAIARNQ